MGGFGIPEIVLTLLALVLIVVIVYFVVRKIRANSRSESYTPGSDTNPGEEDVTFNEQVIGQNYEQTYGPGFWECVKFERFRQTLCEN